MNVKRNPQVGSSQSLAIPLALYHLVESCSRSGTRKSLNATFSLGAVFSTDEFIAVATYAVAVMYFIS